MIIERINEILTNRHFSLLEALAEHIAQTILIEFELKNSDDIRHSSHPLFDLIAATWTSVLIVVFAWWRTASDVARPFILK